MIFEGSAVALVTPFGDDGINVEVLRALIEFQIGEQTDAILINGTTGEPPTMQPEEKTVLIEETIRQVDGRVPVIVGVGGNSTRTAAQEANRAREAGAQAVLAVTPYYNRCTDDGLIAHFETIADAAELPVIVYNIPGRTSMNITPELFARLVQHPWIQAIKEASGNISQITETARLTSGQADIYSGNDDHIVPVLSLGGKGVISVLSNIMPRYVHDLVMAYRTGETETALQMQLGVNGLVHALFSEVNPIPVKTALHALGYAVGDVRLPLTPLSSRNEMRLLREMELLGLIGAGGEAQ